MTASTTTYRVALVADRISVGTADPSTLQEVVKDGEYEWNLRSAKAIAKQLNHYGLFAAVINDTNEVVFCA